MPIFHCTNQVFMVQNLTLRLCKIVLVCLISIFLDACTYQPAVRPSFINGKWRVVNSEWLDRVPDETAYRGVYDSCVGCIFTITDSSLLVYDVQSHSASDRADTAYNMINPTGCMASMRKGFGYHNQSMVNYDTDSIEYGERFCSLVYDKNNRRSMPVYRTNYDYPAFGNDSADIYQVDSNRLIIHHMDELIFLKRYISAADPVPEPYYQHISFVK